MTTPRLLAARSLIFGVLVALAVAAPAFAETPSAPVVDPSLPSPQLDPSDQAVDGTQQKSGPGVTPLFAPVPFKDTQIGWGLFLLAGVIHRFDADTTIKPSTGVVGAFYSENKSWGWMAMEMARLQRDRWRLRGMVAHFDVNYDFFGIGEEAGTAGNSIPLEQSIDMAMGAVLRRVTPGFYLGGSVLWMRTEVEIGDLPAGVATPADDLARTNLFAPGLSAEYDTRDDDYWPSSGSVAKLRSNFFSKDFGSSRDFQRYFASWSWYRSLQGERRVLAANVNGGASAGDVPFYGIPTVGGGNYGLRGYQQGRYRDQVMITAQAELRLHTEGRAGVAVFGGFGQVAPSIGELTEARVLPAGGLGVRYQLTAQYPMHLRMDYAWGLDEGIFYFAVAEAF